MDSAVDVKWLEGEADRLAKELREAQPFPHLVLDDAVSIPRDVLGEFPPPDWEGWDPLGDAYQLQKFACDDIDRIPAPFAGLIEELSRPRFLRVLEKITGIQRLIPDPYLTGGGLHLSGPGGILAPHTDFHIYSQLGLYRRVNILVYFNEDWREEYGGCLELRSEDDAGNRRTVVPTWGRCVIFITDDKSVHGFPNPIVDGRWRRSLALYYYTAEEAPTFSGDATTYWREHQEREKSSARIRFGLYKVLLQGSRALSLLAHLVNPNQGLGWWKVRSSRVRKRKESGR
jgi:hypothetical protein